MKKQLLLLLMLVAVTASTQAQTGYIYNFRNNLDESLTGPALAATCTDSFVSDMLPDYTLTRPVYHFGQGCGLNFNDSGLNFLSTGSYTIEMYAALDTVLSYRKMIDFQNYSSAGGLYLLDSSLFFYSVLNTSNPLYTAGKYVFTVISRNGVNQQVKLYVQGNYMGSFTDAGGDAFYDSYKKLRFFQDDSLSAYTEASAGKIAYLAIYNYVRDSLLIHNDYDSLGNILAATNVKNLSSQNNIQLWPNPATSVLQVSSITEVPYVVTDLTGRQISNGTLLKGENKINVASFARGMYLIKLQGGNAGAVYKFIKD